MAETAVLTVCVDKPTQFIRNFFDNKAAAEMFLRIGRFLARQDDQLIVRTDCSIIGMSRPGERYWFYVSKKDGQWQIKFKHVQEAKAFPEGRAEEYHQLCLEILRYYASNTEEFLLGSKDTKVESAPMVPVEKAYSERGTAEEKTRPERSCENCHLRVSERCSSLSNIVCEDYIPRVYVAQEERANWPTSGDATATRNEFWTRRYRDRST